MESRGMVVLGDIVRILTEESPGSPPVQLHWSPARLPDVRGGLLLGASSTQ